MADHAGNPDRPFNSREANRGSGKTEASQIGRCRSQEANVGALTGNLGVVYKSMSPASQMKQGRWMEL